MIVKEGEDWENLNDLDDVLGICVRVSNIFVFWVKSVLIPII